MKHKFVLPIVIAVIVIAIIVSLVYTQSGLQQQGPKVVKIGYKDSVPTSNLPVFVALEKGYFEEEGIKPEPVNFQTSNTEAEALSNNQIDVGVDIATTVVYAVEQRSPGNFKIFMTHSLSEENPLTAIVVKKDSKIDEIKNLQGKKMAIFPGSTALKLTKLAFKKMGYGNLSVELISLTPNLWLGALSTGQVDAVLTYEPFGTQILQQEGFKKISSAPIEKFVFNGKYSGANTAFSTKFANENPEITTKIIKVFEKSLEFIEANPVEARQLMVKYSNTQESVAKEVPLLTWEIGENIEINKLQEYADVLLQEGELEKQIDVTKLLYIIPQKIS